MVKTTRQHDKKIYTAHDMKWQMKIVNIYAEAASTCCSLSFDSTFDVSSTFTFFVGLVSSESSSDDLFSAVFSSVNKNYFTS